MGITHLSHINGELAGDCNFEIYDPSWYFKLASLFRVRKNIRFLGKIPNKKYDGVIITSPPQFHSLNFRETLALSDKFFVEKPLMLSDADIEEAKTDNKDIYCGYVLRKNPCVQHLQSLVDGQEELNVEVEVLSNLGQDQTDDWRFDINKGGGCINELGSHAINLALKFATLKENAKNVKNVHHLDVGTFSVDLNSANSVHITGNWNTNVRKTMYKLSVSNENLKLTTDLQNITGEIDGKTYEWSPRVDPLSVGFYIRGADFALQSQDWLKGNISNLDLGDALAIDTIIREVIQHD